jgi:hypothetical protein
MGTRGKEGGLEEVLIDQLSFIVSGANEVLGM